MQLNFRFSTNARQLFTRQHIDDPRAADACFHDDDSGMLVRNIADDRSGPTEWVGLHCRENSIGIDSTRANQELAFVSNVKRVQTENLARALDLFTDRDRG